MNKKGGEKNLTKISYEFYKGNLNFVKKLLNVGAKWDLSIKEMQKIYRESHSNNKFINENIYPERFELINIINEAKSKGYSNSFFIKTIHEFENKNTTPTNHTYNNCRII